MVTFLDPLRGYARQQLADNARLLKGEPRPSPAPAQAAPRTRVTVSSYDVPSKWLERWGYELRPWAKRLSPDHMYVEYDDGREQYIFRGGPSGPFLGAEVTPARRSKDHGRGERVLHRADLPGQTAREAIRPAQAAARQVNGAGQPYLVFGSNSNSVVGDLTAEQLRHRVGDRQTPGYRPEPLSPYMMTW